MEKGKEELIIAFGWLILFIIDLHLCLISILNVAFSSSIFEKIISFIISFITLFFGSVFLSLFLDYLSMYKNR